jgi:hypothetical protein
VRGYADAAIREKKAEIDGIARPAVNAGCHEHTGGLVRGQRRRSTREVADSRGKKHKTDEDQGPGDNSGNPVDLRNCEWQMQQPIQGETDQNSGGKEKARSPNDACRCGAVSVLPNRIATHACSSKMLEAMQEKVAQNDN